MANGASLTPEILAGWADALQALARTGLFYPANDYDRERYKRFLAIADAFAMWHDGWQGTAFDP